MKLAPPVYAALLLAGCSNEPATLPTDPIERAAICGVVATAHARVNTPDISAPLSLEAQGEVLRLVLLSGASSEQFASEPADAVVKRMPALAETVTAGDNWKELAPPCAAAFPPPATPPELPAEPLTAALGCDQLARFMNDALSASADYEEALFRYAGVERVLDSRIAPLFAARGITSEDGRAAEKDEALAAMAKLGNPVKVMDACLARYAED